MMRRTKIYTSVRDWFVIVSDMFGIVVCNLKFAHINGRNGFLIRLFPHVFASNTVTHVLFNV